jgi:YesN/AraC family two-component response regulator
MPSPAISPSPEGESGSASDDPCRVVIADDATEFRELLRLCLTDGFEVVGEASDGQQAVDTTIAEQPDAIILDLSMPVKDGLQAIPEIRLGSPNTRILVLSGFTEGTMSAKALSLGAHAYIEKGARLRDIEENLSKLCTQDDCDEA